MSRNVMFRVSHLLEMTGILFRQLLRQFVVFEGSADVIVTGYKNHPIDYFHFNREPNKRNMNSIEFPSFPYKFRTRQCFGYEIVFRRKCE